VRNRGEKKNLLPLFSARPGEEETYGAVQNGTVFASSLFFFFYKWTVSRRCFSENAPFHLNGFWGQNASDSKSGL